MPQSGIEEGPALESSAVHRKTVSRAAPSPAPPITEVLVDWMQGDQNALDRLAPLVYKELRRLAQTR